MSAPLDLDAINAEKLTAEEVLFVANAASRHALVTAMVKLACERDALLLALQEAQDALRESEQTASNQAAHLRLIAKELRDFGDIKQVRLGDEGVTDDPLTVADVLELIAIQLAGVLGGVDETTGETTTWNQRDLIALWMGRRALYAVNGVGVPIDPPGTPTENDYAFADELIAALQSNRPSLESDKT